MAKYELSKHLMKITYPLIVQLHWHHAEMFYVRNNYEIVYLWSTILGDSWNYMAPILVLSSAKRITTQVLVTETLNARNYFILRGFVCDIIRAARKYLLKVSYWSTRIGYENCSGLRMKKMVSFQCLSW